MADVFISYARADEAFAERLAKRLEALGLSVWWDRRLLPGDDWELAIEEAIDAAKAVIVIWSQESVRSKPVRAEARRADRRDKLVPIAIETVEPPLFSSGVHFEDFSDWTDDTAALEFQDLWRQLIALRDDAAAASLVPRDGETPIAPLPGANAAPTPGAAGLDPDAPVLKASWLNRPIGPFSSFAKLLEFAVAIGGVAWLFINRENLIGTYWNAVVSAAI
ncbi:MAG: toll/interleukin-1 receptor domain-containing protein, partial [Pseudomonadota bacterium]